MPRNIFNQLSCADRDACRAAGQPRLLEAGETLFREGEHFTDSIFLLESGEITLHRGSGGQQTLSPGYFMGLSGYFTGAPYTATAVANIESTVIEIESASLHEVERTHPSIADGLNRMITASLSQRRPGLLMGARALTQPVASIMSRPVLRCAATTSLRQVVQEMLAANVGSMIIDGRPARAVTYRSAARVLSQDLRAEFEPTAADAAESIQVTEPQAPVWKVQELLRDAATRHVLVARGGQHRGVVSQADLNALVQGTFASVSAQIQDARHMDDLHRHYRDLHVTAARLLDSNRHAGDAIASLSEVHLTIQRRCIALTLEQLRDTGAGAAPCPYALIIMGSGGRREMLLDPDQDNALILADEAHSAPAMLDWFETFGDALNSNLAQCGYALCEGDIMARNPAFRKTLSQWTAQVDLVSGRPTQKAARWASILFDFELQHGELGLADALRDHVAETMSHRPSLLAAMVNDDAQGRAPLGWFNRLVATGEREGKAVIDLKRNGLRMIGNATRILALAHGIGASSTVDRLRGLARIGVMSPDFATTVRDAFDDLLAITITHQIDQRRLGVALDKEIAPEDLSWSRKESLRVAMRAVNRLQDFMQAQVASP